MVAPQFPPQSGGCALTFGSFVDNFEKGKDIDTITMLSTFWPGEPERKVKGKLTVLRKLPPLPKASTRIGWVLGEVLRFPFSFFITLATALNTRPDLLHVHKTRSLGGAVLAGKLLRIPVLCDVQDLHTLDVYRISDHFIACGQAAIEKMSDSGIPKDRIDLYPVPIPLKGPVDEGGFEELSKGPLKGKKFVLYVGEVSEMKGIPELIEGFKELRKGHKDLALLLVGRSIMGDLPRFDWLHSPGPMPYPKVLGLMKHAEAVILPSKFELFPRVCVEACMMGAKVVFPPCVPEFREMFKDFVLPEITPKAITRTLERVLGSEDRPKYPFDIHDGKKVADKIIATYRKMLRDR